MTLFEKNSILWYQRDDDDEFSGKYFINLFIKKVVIRNHRKLIKSDKHFKWM